MPPAVDVSLSAAERASPRRFLWSLSCRLRQPLGTCAAYGAACMLAQALVPSVLGRAMDQGVIARDGRALATWCGALLGLACVQALTSIMRDRRSVDVRLASSLSTLRSVTVHAVDLGAGLSKRTVTGEVVSIGVTDVRQIGNAFGAVGQGVGALVAIVTVAVIMLTASWRLGAVVFLGVLVMTWANAQLIRMLRARRRHLRARQGQLTECAVDIIGGLRVLRGVGGEGTYGARYQAASQRVRSAGVRTGKVEALAAGVRILLPGVLTVVVVWVGAHLVATHRIGIGQFVAFYSYSVFLITPLRWLTQTLDALTAGYVAVRTTTDFLAIEAESASWNQERGPGEVAGPAALTDPDSGAVIRPGLLTAIVCARHEDKTRLVDALAGHSRETAAAYGRVPLRELPHDELRRRILVVRNDDRLFAGRMRTELDPADQSTENDRPLERAVDAASARDIVDGLPGGLDGHITENARIFSGGEQQRLRLVRGLTAGPEVLMLVDPTSAVDALTEARMAEGLADYRNGRTTVVFTTSPVLLGQADQVIYIEDGRAVAEGTHRELLSEHRYRLCVEREAAV